MKFFISGMMSLFFFLFSHNASAKLALAPVVITFKSHNQFVDSVVKILHSQFGIPSPLLELRAQANECQRIQRAILQICILEDEEIKLINWDKEKWGKDYGEFGNFVPKEIDLKNLPLTASQSETTEVPPNERKQ